ncbi:MAG: DUF58 domain-containing protein [Chitinophagales bacterium]|nr:DUF58 domain-containing protein [Chitinophagales bacterium]
METAELLKKVRTIEIKTRGLCSDAFSGEYHSAFKGRGMSFSDVREYQPGDEIRSIDWNVTARLNHPYVKVFEEERELSIMLLIDASRSMQFGTVRAMKHELISEISAVLAYSAIKNNDKVGIIFFTETIEKFIPPKKGRSHVLRIIRDLIDFKPSSAGTNIFAALHFLNNIMKKQSVVFLLSDFLNYGYDPMLRIASRKHDLVGIHVYDKRERELPDAGLSFFTDAETGKKVCIDTSDKSVRKEYGISFIENLSRLKTTFLQSGAEMVSISTAENYIRALMNFFVKRIHSN